jgi:hypothetical protein
MAAIIEGIPLNFFDLVDCHTSWPQQRLQGWLGSK